MLHKWLLPVVCPALLLATTLLTALRLEGILTASTSLLVPTWIALVIAVVAAADACLHRHLLYQMPQTAKQRFSLAQEMVVALCDERLPARQRCVQRSARLLLFTLYAVSAAMIWVLEQGWYFRSISLGVFLLWAWTCTPFSGNWTRFLSRFQATLMLLPFSSFIVLALLLDGSPTTNIIDPSAAVPYPWAQIYAEELDSALLSLFLAMVMTAPPMFCLPAAGNHNSEEVAAEQQNTRCSRLRPRVGLLKMLWILLGLTCWAASLSTQCETLSSCTLYNWSIHRLAPDSPPRPVENAATCQIQSGGSWSPPMLVRLENSKATLLRGVLTLPNFTSVTDPDQMAKIRSSCTSYEILNVPTTDAGMLRIVVVQTGLCVSCERVFFAQDAGADGILIDADPSQWSRENETVGNTHYVWTASAQCIRQECLANGTVLNETRSQMPIIIMDPEHYLNWQQLVASSLLEQPLTIEISRGWLPADALVWTLLLPMIILQAYGVIASACIAARDS